MSRNPILRTLAALLAGVAVALGMTGPPVVVPAHAAQTLVVNSEGDTGACGTAAMTLRCAITQADADGAGDTIKFDIVPSGSCCFISLGSALPGLTAGNTTIDGYSQPGASKNSNPLSAGDNAVVKIQVDGASAGSGVNGLNVFGSNDTVDGLDLTNFQPVNGAEGWGIALEPTTFGGPIQGDAIWGNFLGVSPSGSSEGANAIGVGVAAGTTATTIGGPSPAQANLISGNSSAGIDLNHSSANIIQGNYIGTDITGTKSVANGAGVVINADTGKDAIGGPGAGNVISGNAGLGIAILPTISGAGPPGGALGGTIQGNLIGVAASATGRLANVSGGILINDGSSFEVGGPGSGQGNVISGNGVPGVVAAGVELRGALSSSNIIEGNAIGVTAGGVKMPNNGAGVLADQGASSDAVGLSGLPAASNTIADNGGFGVDLGNGPSDSVHVSVNLNSMYGNNLGGIRLSGQNQLLCTTGAAYIQDTTPNDLTACPLILAATPQRIVGEACTGCTVEIYMSAGRSDDEGKTLLGTLTAGVCTSPPCQNFTTFSFPASKYSQALTANDGEFITATSTETYGAQSPNPTQTSSFSRNVPVGQTLVVNTTADAASPCSSAAYALRCALTQANGDLGDEIDFGIPSGDSGCSSGFCTIKPTSSLPEVQSASTYVDGYSQTGASPNSNQLASGDNATLTIGIDGAGLPVGSNGLQFLAGYDSVEGLVITGFSGDGVIIGATQTPRFDIVAGNFIGTRANGSTAAPNGNGVEINGNGFLATVGGRAIVDPDVISGNTNYGVESSGPGANTLRENLIGVNAAGKTAVQNGYDGVLLFGTHADTIGGIRPGEGNVISGNFNDGIEGLDTKLSSIVGNEIGVDGASNPKVPVGNGFSGIFLYLGADNLVGDLPFGTGANVIAGNRADGVDVMAETGDFVTGNVVGYVAPNGGNGVMFGSSSYVTGEFASHTFGRGASRRALTRLVKQRGVRQEAWTTASGIRRTDQGGPVVGGEQPLFEGAAVNVIAGNGSNGVLVGQSANDADVHVLISQNAMLSNGSGNGIDFFGSGGFCAGTNPGPNDGLFCPIIGASNLDVVTGTSCAGCTVEVFVASNGSSDNGYGEGQQYLGAAVAGGNGNWSLNISKAALPTGAYVTATATSYVGNSYQQVGNYEFETSEFSANVQLTRQGAARRSRTKPRHPVRVRLRQRVNWKRLNRLFFSHATGKHPRFHVRFKP